MSWSWLGRRALYYTLTLGAVAAVAIWIVSQPPRVGYATAVAGVPINRTLPQITGDQRLGGVLTCSRGTWDETADTGTYATSFQWVRDNVDLTGRTSPQYTVGTADIGRSLRAGLRRRLRRSASADR